MRANGRKRTMSAAAALSLVAALVLGGPPTARAASDGPPQGGPNEGIKVHGDWTIDIKNADGSIASHHEFKNALGAHGALRLALFLGRLQAPGLWTVFVYSPAGTANCNGNEAPCVLAEEAAYHGSRGLLTVSVPESGPNQGRLVVSGAFTSPDARQIDRVESVLTTCPIGSAGCAIFPTLHPFSQRNLQSPIPVLAGQIVQVSVVFSFS